MRNINEVSLAAVSAAADQAGAAISGAQLFAMSVQAVVTGTSTGTLKMQFSNDVVNQKTPPAPPTNWSDLSGISVAIAGAGVYNIPKFDVCYAWLRPVFVHANAAAGTITVTPCRGGA